MYEIEYRDFVWACSILCIAAVPPIETHWFETRDCIAILPSGELCWPVKFTY